MKNVIGWTAAVVASLAVGYGAWKLERWLNWKLDWQTRRDLPTGE